MTPDDEAFVRAVVDRPGDDLPRLVYADWLDERGDPRGTYLRAETEWAKTPIHGDEEDIIRLAAGIDPVWVARVSRPPVGVCCDHVRFVETGPVLDNEEIDESERRLGGRFAPDYRAFLLNHNGGRPIPAFLAYPESVGWDDMDLEVGCFNPACRAGGSLPDQVYPLESEREFMEELFETGGGVGMNPLIAGLVPIADTLHDLGYFLLGINDDNRGRVYHFRDYCHWSNDPEHLAAYSATFAELLGLLRHERQS